LDSKNFQLDLFPQTSRRTLTVYDESWIPAKSKDDFRSECPYELGKPITSCEFFGSFYPFTSLKREANQLFIGTSTKGGYSNGRSAERRYTRIDPTPFSQTAKTQDYSYFNSF
jgi:hypothetical protein